jgi:putative hydrolase of the HAD superfamily
MRKIIENLGVAHYFESIIISGEVGEQKPSANLINRIKSELNCEKAFVVGDMVIKDILGANMAGVPGIWANIKPSSLPKSIAALNAGSVTLDSSIYALK